jgi:hypothetical protein
VNTTAPNSPRPAGGQPGPDRPTAGSPCVEGAPAPLQPLPHVCPDQQDTSHPGRPGRRLKQALVLLHAGTDPDAVARLTGFPREVITYLADPEQPGPAGPPPPPRPPRRGLAVAVLAACGLAVTLIGLALAQPTTAVVIASLIVVGVTATAVHHRRSPGRWNGPSSPGPAGDRSGPTADPRELW